jgi:archaellum component FlaC
MATARDLRTTHRVEERVMNVENALQRLEISVQNERRMEAAQDLGAMHHVDVTVDTVDTIEHDEQTRSIEGRVQGVDGQVHCVDERLQGIDERVKTVDNKIDVVIDGAYRLSAKPSYPSLTVLPIGIEQIRELRVQQEVVYTIDEKREYHGVISFLSCHLAVEAQVLLQGSNSSRTSRGGPLLQTLS